MTGDMSPGYLWPDMNALREQRKQIQAQLDASRAYWWRRTSGYGSAADVLAWAAAAMGQTDVDLQYTYDTGNYLREAYVVLDEFQHDGEQGRLEAGLRQSEDGLQIVFFSRFAVEGSDRTYGRIRVVTSAANYGMSLLAHGGVRYFPVDQEVLLQRTVELVAEMVACEVLGIYQELYGHSSSKIPPEDI